MEHFQQALYWHIRKIVFLHEDADDVLQNTYIKVWKGLVNFRKDSKIYTWLYRIATNEALSFLRSKKAMHEEVEAALWNIQTDPHFDGDEVQVLLWQGINSLPEKQRAVFVMKYFDDKTYVEMAEIMETSVGALKASYHHATKKIKAFVRDKDLFI